MIKLVAALFAGVFTTFIVCGCKAGRSNADAISPQDPAFPAAPTNLSTQLVSPFQIHLSWSASRPGNAPAYRVFRNGTAIATTNSTSYIDSGLTASTDYSYAVSAVDDKGISSLQSAALNTRTLAVSNPTAYPLKLSTDRRFLVDQNNVPFFVNGEDGFLASIELSDSEVDAYLADRASRGINSVWIGLADQVDQSNPPQDAFGNAPFSGPWFSSTEVSAYWQHQDSVIQRAAAKGIVVFAQPSFVGNADSQTAYDTKAMLAASEDMMKAYGSFIGNRYKTFPNIVWVLGGDYDPSQAAIKRKLTDFAAGLVAADADHLITIEACRFCTPTNQSSLDSYDGSPPQFLDLNWLYSQQPNIVPVAQSNFSRSPFLPPFLGEDFYELEHSMTEFQVRQEGYWAVLGGAYVGRLFGNGAIWSFNSTKGGRAVPSWESQLGSLGSVAQENLGHLMASREHWLMVPDIRHEILTAGFGSGPNLSVAARSSDGQTIIAYFSDGNATTKTIDMSKIVSSHSSVKAWWFDPRTGTDTLIGTFANHGSRSFAAPDGNDWVLVLDDASANLPPPGTVSSESRHP